MAQVHLLTGRRIPGDSRITLVRVVFKRTKFSISLQPRFWLWRKGSDDLRVTVLGINLHLVRTYGGTFY